MKSTFTGEDLSPARAINEALRELKADHQAFPVDADEPEVVVTQLEHEWLKRSNQHYTDRTPHVSGAIQLHLHDRTANNELLAIPTIVGIILIYEEPEQEIPSPSGINRTDTEKAAARRAYAAREKAKAGRSPQIFSVMLVTTEFDRGPVDQIRVAIGGLFLSCDLVDGRQLRLAERMAEDAGVELFDNRKPHGDQ